MVGRLPGSPKQPGSGRRKGSLDKQQRALITGEIAADILAVFKKLGGRRFLETWARNNETEFVRQCLARLMPAFPKDPNDDAGPLVNINLGDTTDVARRIAYALAKGVAEQENAHETLLAEREPYVHLAREEENPFVYPPGPDPERAEYFMSPEEKLANESLDQHCSRRAFADRDSPRRPDWMPAEERPARVPVRLRSKRDLL